MSLRNMRIGVRASLSFGVLASLLVIVGLFGLGQMAKLRESALIIEQSWMPSIENIHDSAAYVASIRLETLRLATTDESRIRDNSKSLITRQRSELQTLLEHHETLLSNDQERELLKQLKVNVNSYLNLVGQIVTLVDGDQQQDAIDLLNTRLAPQGVVLGKSLESLITFNQSGVESAVNAAARTYSSALWVVGLIIVFALIATLALAWLLTRSITAPISQALTVARTIAAGDLSQPITVQGHDEPAQLLGALAGILPADGAVLLGGEVLTDLSWPELARRRAMLPQRQPQLFHIPVFQVLSLGLDEEGLPETQGRAVAEICAALELDALLARDFSRLSGGEQQRVLIARTLLQLWPGLNTDGRVLLLDEPLAGLDLHHQLALLRLLKRLSRQGLLVVIAIHDINLAIDWADRILCLQQGRVVSEGGVDVIDEALLERVFQIKTDRVEAAGRVWFMPSL